MENKVPIKYMVWDVEETLAVCTIPEMTKLNTIIDRVQELRHNEGRNPSPRYLVVSEDEPYFKMVAEYIEAVRQQFGGQDNANS